MSNRPFRPSQSREKNLPSGLHYTTSYLTHREKERVLSELERLHPIWEMRYSASNPPPAGQEQRQLLRPVYWLGNWQFACLNYYHPPKGIDFRCVEAEPYPPELAHQVRKIEEFVGAHYPARDIPRGWTLNTCLVNYYGAEEVNDQWTDMARVGEHKDFEPGPVASLSFGERALFQFVSSRSKNDRSQVRMQMWLEDNSLQIFGGDRWKKQLFHRVQRVETKGRFRFAQHLQNYRTRRLNLTFRYVPREHVLPLRRFPANLQADVRPYVEELARSSAHFRDALTSLTE